MRDQNKRVFRAKTASRELLVRYTVLPTVLLVSLLPPLPLRAWRMAAPLGEPRPVHGSQPGPAL